MYFVPDSGNTAVNKTDWSLPWQKLSLAGKKILNNEAKQISLPSLYFPPLLFFGEQRNKIFISTVNTLKLSYNRLGTEQFVCLVAFSLWST